MEHSLEKMLQMFMTFFWPILTLVFLLAPPASLTYFVISLAYYLAYRKHPESFPEETIKKRKTRFIVSLIVLLAIIAITVILAYVFSLALADM